MNRASSPVPSIASRFAISPSASRKDLIISSILVTGAAGFIGSHLCEYLVSSGHQVTGIDRFSDYYSPRLKLWNFETARSAGTRLVEADLLEIDLVSLLSGFTHVVHLAGQPGVRPSWGESFDWYLRDNVAATQALLEASNRSAQIEKFVYASSSSVYGDAETYPTSESATTAPRSPYGVTKLAGENLTTLYAKNFGLPTISLRFFTVYGARQRPDMAFHRLLRSLLSAVPFTVLGDGSQVREFTNVSDIVKAIGKALFAPTPAGSVVNLSGGSSISLSDAIATAEELTNTRLLVNYAATAHGDVHRTGGNTDRALELLNWSPEMNLRDGLRSEIAWIEEAIKAGVL